jgi:hypothetical protein
VTWVSPRRGRPPVGWGRSGCGGRGGRRTGAGVTASVGATDVRPGGAGDEALGRADQAMYRAEGAGGNRVTVLAGRPPGRREPVPRLDGGYAA